MIDDSTDISNIPKDEKKRIRRLQEDFELLKLDPWERYRVLTDFSKQLLDLMDMADRKTRFALVILAVLNTVNFVAVARGDLLTGTKAELGAGLAIYVTFYVGLSLYLCLQAISALKPRLASVLQETADLSKSQKWIDLLSLAAIPKLAADDYYELWRNAKFGQLNREIAFGNQSSARVILLKNGALHRLYTGLSVLVFLTSFLILFFLYSRLEPVG